MLGGEQQRVAIATAVANEPALLLADEPTGELDSVTADSVFSALKAANTELGVTVLIVTHDTAVSATSGGSSRSGTAGQARRPCGTTAVTGRLSGTPSSTPCLTGPDDSSCRAR